MGFGRIACRLATGADFSRFGAVAGVPIGLAIITRIGAGPARVVIAAYVLVMCAVMLRGWHMKAEAGPGQHVVAELASGLANAPGMGGLPVVTFFAAQGIPAVTFRATLIAYFALLDGYSAPLMWWHGMISRDTFITIALAFRSWQQACGREAATSCAPTRRISVVLP